MYKILPKGISPYDFLVEPSPLVASIGVRDVETLDSRAFFHRFCGGRKLFEMSVNGGSSGAQPPADHRGRLRGGLERNPRGASLESGGRCRYQ